MFLRVDLIIDIFPFSRALFSEAITTAERIPMIAMTTSNSINVNALFDFRDSFFTFLLYHSSFKTKQFP